MIWHRYRRQIALLAALAVATLGSAPLSATEPEPTKRTERVYFTCNDTVLHDVNEFQKRLPGWSTTAPAASATPVGGCGSQDWGGNATNENALNDAAWQGDFTGNLDSITVDGYYASALGAAAPTGPVKINVRLVVDGEPYWVAATTAMGRPVTVSPDAVGPGTSRIRFTIKDIAKLVEPGDGANRRQIKLFLGETTQNHSNGVWLWGTPERPAGLTFNPVAPEAATISVNDPCTWPGC